MPAPRFALAVAFANVLACTSDDGDDPPACVEFELSECAQLYPPTYDQVWTQTLADGCTGGSSCHAQAGSGGAAEGLTFTDAMTTWQHVIDQELVVPGDPLCSPLFVRVATDDPELRMPPGGNGLPAGALCSIGTWIADGAEYTPP